MILANIKKVDISKYINYLAVFYAFTIPLSKAGIVFCSISMILLWILEGNFREKIQTIISYKFVNLGLILFIYLFLSSFWSDDIFQGFKHFERFWYFGTFFVLLTSLRKEYIKYIISAFIFAMFISEILSYGIVFELWTLKHGSPSNPTPIMYHVEYSLFLAFTSLLLLNKVFIEDNIKYKIFYGLFFITATGNLFLGQGRTGQLIFLISLFILFMINMKNKFKSFLLAAFLSLMIGFIAYNVSTTFQNRVNAGIIDVEKIIEGDYTGSWGGRVSAWIATKKILENNLLFGTGIGDIKNDYKYLMISENEPKHSQKYVIAEAGYHSDLLEISSGGGLVAMFLYLLIFYYLYKLDTINKEYKNILIILISVFAIGNIADNFLRIQFTMDLFSLFVSLIATQKRFKKELYEKNFNN